MFVKCLNCGHEFEECGASFDVNVDFESWVEFKEMVEEE